MGGAAPRPAGEAVGVPTPRRLASLVGARLARHHQLGDLGADLHRLALDPALEHHEQRLAIPRVTVADTGDMPRPLVAAAHLDVAAVKQAASGFVERGTVEHPHGERRFRVGEHEHAAQPHGYRCGKRVADLSFEHVEPSIGRPIADGEMRW